MNNRPFDKSSPAADSNPCPPGEGRRVLPIDERELGDLVAIGGNDPPYQPYESRFLPEVLPKTYSPECISGDSVFLFDRLDRTIRTDLVEDALGVLHNRRRTKLLVLTRRIGNLPTLGHLVMHRVHLNHRDHCFHPLSTKLSLVISTGEHNLSLVYLAPTTRIELALSGRQPDCFTRNIREQIGASRRNRTDAHSLQGSDPTTRIRLALVSRTGLEPVCRP